jgi:hypothetical protein
MSSHHFVKEGQEAALVIIDALPYEIIAPVLEWSPLVIVFQDALEEVMTWSIKIDVVICRKDGCEQVSELVKEQYPVEIVSVDSWPAATSIVLDLLVNENQHSVVIAIRNAEQMMQELDSFDHVQVSVLAPDGLKWSRYGKGLFEKWMANGEQIHVRGVVDDVAAATLEGDKAKATADGVVKVRGRGHLWIGEAV